MSDYDLLHRIGRAIWGEHWHMPMAERFDVRERTIRYWLSGRYDVPHAVWQELRGMLSDKLADVAESIKDLDKRIGHDVS